jgi:hypothetical protein
MSDLNTADREEREIRREEGRRDCEGRPKRIDNFEEISFEHLIIEDVQVMGDEVIRLQERGKLGHLKGSLRSPGDQERNERLTVASNSSKDLFFAALATAAMASNSMVPA